MSTLVRHKWWQKSATIVDNQYLHGKMCIIQIHNKRNIWLFSEHLARDLENDWTEILARDLGNDWTEILV